MLCHACCYCELAAQSVTMATQWSLGTRAVRASVMATASTLRAEIFVMVRRASVCHAPATPKAGTVNAVDVATMARR